MGSLNVNFFVCYLKIIFPCCHPTPFDCFIACFLSSNQNFTHVKTYPLLPSLLNVECPQKCSMQNTTAWLLEMYEELMSISWENSKTTVRHENPLLSCLPLHKRAIGGEGGGLRFLLNEKFILNYVYQADLYSHIYWKNSKMMIHQISIFWF